MFPDTGSGAAGLSLDLAALAEGYRTGALTPGAVLREVLRRIGAAGEDHVWISRRPDADILAEADALSRDRQTALPLFGVPFAVKDNIDAAPLPTTAGCPDYAFQPDRSAPVVERLVAAGAVLIGKTNLDQFATGLVGTRSPYGVARNPFDASMIPGGSSSGSAVAVAAGLVSFALGTDTAGSGRVPAGFNNIVGAKPTRGLLSTHGVVPACQSLDCVSVFALTVADAVAVLEVAQGFEAADPYARSAPPGFALRTSRPARFRFGVPQVTQREFAGNPEAAALFETAIARASALGGEAVTLDFAPFIECASLLYGPWVAERAAAVGDFLRGHPDSLHPVTAKVIGTGFAPDAVSLFGAQHRLAALAQMTRPVWRDIDFLLVPTAPTAFSIAEIDADPIGRNGLLGFYTNFVNLLDLAAIAVPAGFTGAGFPSGVTLIGPAWHDGRLAAFAADLHEAVGKETPIRMGATAHTLPRAGTAPPRPGSFPDVEIAVFGAHLSGEPLNPDLVARGGSFRRACRTSAGYRMLALPGAVERPALCRVASGGAAIEGEVWALPAAALAGFLATIAPPLGLGTVELDGGEACIGFVCDPGGAQDAADITRFGGWRNYRRR